MFIPLMKVFTFLINLNYLEHDEYFHPFLSKFNNHGCKIMV